jgi:hypothetical protein
MGDIVRSCLGKRGGDAWAGHGATLQAMDPGGGQEVLADPIGTGRASITALHTLRARPASNAHSQASRTADVHVQGRADAHRTH